MAGATVFINVLPREFDLILGALCFQRDDIDDELANPISIANDEDKPGMKRLMEESRDELHTLIQALFGPKAGEDGED